MFEELRRAAVPSAEGGERWVADAPPARDAVLALRDQLADLHDRLEEAGRERAELAGTLQALLALARGLQLELRSATCERQELRVLLRDLREHLERQEEQTRGEGAPDARTAYRRLVRRVRESVCQELPLGATVLVVSRGDDDLLNLWGRTGWHFPRLADGTYAGSYPAESAGAVVQLETLRARGAEFLVFPQTALWWLSHFAGFRRHLERRYRRVPGDEETCVMFDLREPTAGSGAARAPLEEAVEEFRRAYGRFPAVLDVGSGLALRESLPDCPVFSPPTAAAELPYLDRSVDLVVARAADEAGLAEAHRVADFAVIAVSEGEEPAGRRPAPDRIRVIRASPEGAEAAPSASVIIPVYNAWAHTRACLRALRETLPHFRGEIIVVDDASTDETAAALEECSRVDDRLRVIRNESNFGFIASCNRAAEAASGEMLVFLNNDTVPLTGWLSALLRTFGEYPDAGAVGGKLVYPDGRLQEAGGVIFSDGSGANFGRLDPAVEAPLYGFVREVDYCSGALLATPRRLFASLGGFDVRFRPAYYEDTDYCFAVRERGLRVYYQPESVVVHCEGATSGTDLGGGVKRSQVVNRGKFVEKWAHRLVDQPPPPGRFDASVWHRLARRGNGGAGRAP